MKTKFSFILITMLLLICLVSCSEKKTNGGSSTTVKANTSGTTDYYPILSSTSNGGMRFNMTLQEFIENYNQLVEEYSTQYSIVDKDFVVGSDFKKQNNSKDNINGVLSDMYICSSTLFGYNPNIGICVGVEKDSHYISEVSVAIDNNMQQSFSEEQRVLYTIQRHIVYRSLINELTLESCYHIDDSMQTNSKNGYVPAHFEKGVAFSLDLSNVKSTGIAYFRIQPCTKEQWKLSPGFKDITID